MDPVPERGSRTPLDETGAPAADVTRLGITYSIGNVAQNALAVLLLPLYTSYLSAADYGALALLAVTVALFTKVASAPMTAAYDRFCYRPDYQVCSGELIFNILLVLSFKSVLLFMIYLGISDFIAGSLFRDTQLIAAVRMYGIILLLTPLSTFALVYLRLRKMARLYVFISLSKLVFTTVVIVVLLVWADLGLYALILGTALGHLYICAFSLPILIKSSSFRFLPSVLKEPLRYGYPLLISGYSQLLFKSGDRYILSIFRNISSVGIYSVGYSIGNALNAVLVEPMKYALRPHLLQLEAHPERQRAFISSVATYFGLISMFSWLAISLFAREIVLLLTRRPEFWAGHVIVPVIAFTAVLNGYGGFLGIGMVMKNKPYLITFCVIVSAGTNLILNILLVPRWGIMGAALATLIAFLIWDALKLYFSWRLHDVRIEMARIIHITVVVLMLFGLSQLLPSEMGLFPRAILKVLILLSFPAMIVLTGFFTVDERAGIRRWKSMAMEEGLINTIRKALRPS
jgi:O-antigen/teichoic acid export membrane protein